MGNERWAQQDRDPLRPHPNVPNHLVVVAGIGPESRKELGATSGATQSEYKTNRRLDSMAYTYIVVAGSAASNPLFCSIWAIIASNGRGVCHGRGNPLP